MYVCILYCRISARRTFTQLKWQPQLVVSVTYHPRVRQTKFCVLSFPAIWWRSMKLQYGSMTEWQCYSIYKICLLLAEGKERLKDLTKKPHHKIPYHDLNFFCGKQPRSRRYGHTATLRLLVQHYYYYYYYYYYYCPGNGAPME
jgi:hypothetical protein